MELLLVLAGFFVVTVAVVWLLLFPTGRDAISGAAVGTGSRASAWVGYWARGLGGYTGGTYRLVRDVLHATGQFVSHNRRLLTGVALLVCLPPLVIFQMNYDLSLEGISYESDTIDGTLITRLLRGERLAPPPPLVPAMFTTREVELIRPTLSQANRDWGRLDAEFRQRLLVVYKLMRDKHGYNMKLIEGYRSPQRQRKLANTKPGVTNAGAFQSYHQYGLAADSAFLRNGKLVISADNEWAMRGYRLYGRLAEAAGLTWGGDWQLHDFGHVELRRPGVLP